MAPKALNTVVRTLDRLMSGAKSTTQDGNIDAAQRTTRAVVPALSVIVPLYNEEESVRPLYGAIIQAVAPLDRSFEMVFVDDGSHDEPCGSPTSSRGRDPRPALVKFRRNYGQTAAMAAGIEHAQRRSARHHGRRSAERSGRHRAAAASRSTQGYDIVVGWRHDRQDKLISRKIPSRIANWLIAQGDAACRSRTTAARSRPTARRLIKRIPLYSEMHRFIPAMASIAGPRVARDQGAASRARSSASPSTGCRASTKCCSI